MLQITERASEEEKELRTIVPAADEVELISQSSLRGLRRPARNERYRKSPPQIRVVIGPQNRREMDSHIRRAALG
jgi:hypothetical protein